MPKAFTVEVFTPLERKGNDTLVIGVQRYSNLGAEDPIDDVDTGTSRGTRITVYEPIRVIDIEDGSV